MQAFNSIVSGRDPLEQKRAGRPKDVIGAAQFRDLPPQCLELLALTNVRAFALADVNLIALDPVT